MWPGGLGRDSYAGWLDLEVDVTNRWLWSGAPALRETSAMPATPSRARWRAGSRLSDNFALRAAGSTGFRAPSIGQSSLRRAATVFRDGRLQESLTLPPTDPVAMLKGGRQLNPEESVNFSLGAAFALGPVNVTLDWFRITVDGRIVLTEQDLSAENRAELLAANVVGAETVTAVAFFVNDIDTETTGLDLVADTAFDVAGGARRRHSGMERHRHADPGARCHPVRPGRARTGGRPAGKAAAR